MLDADVWRALKAYKWHILHRTYDPEQKIVRWQGKDQNLYEMPIEQLGLTEGPDIHFKTMGGCIGYFLRRFSSNSGYWGEIDKYNDHYREAEPKSEFYQYMFGVVQPRLVELGYWRFVEEHIDDVKEEPRFWAEFVWEDEEDGEDT